MPGQILLGDDPVEVNPGRPVTTLLVRNTADRPVQVGSHFHFAATNPALAFDRDAAWGLRLAVPAGPAVRFEPGIEREVELVPIAGARVVPGLRAESAGPLDGPRGGLSSDPPTTAPLASGTTASGSAKNHDRAAFGPLDPRGQQ
ncbi:MAG: urease subunit beta [Frankia sp.]